MNKTPEQLASDIIIRSIVRFGKVFIVSGVASAALIAPLTGLSYHDLKSYIAAFFVAFISGGTLGVEKMISQLSYASNTTQTQITTPVEIPDSAVDTTQVQ